jgi:hypothetical protein
MNSGQNPLLSKSDISFSEKRIEETYAFFKQMHTELRVRRNIHNERFKRIDYFFTSIIRD